MKLNMRDVRVDSFRPAVPNYSSAPISMRLTHLPTGLSVEGKTDPNKGKEGSHHYTEQRLIQELEDKVNAVVKGE
jgi:hypothetical protein